MYIYNNCYTKYWMCLDCINQDACALPCLYSITHVWDMYKIGLPMSKISTKHCQLKITTTIHRSGLISLVSCIQNCQWINLVVNYVLIWKCPNSRLIIMQVKGCSKNHQHNIIISSVKIMGVDTTLSTDQYDHYTIFKLIVIIKG